MRLFVGNVGYSVSEQEVADFFRSNGVQVRTVKLLKDRETGNSRGFGFIEAEGGAEIVSRMSGLLLHGRPLQVEMAREQGVRQKAPPQRHARQERQERRGRRDEYGWEWDDK